MLRIIKRIVNRIGLLTYYITLETDVYDTYTIFITTSAFMIFAPLNHDYMYWQVRLTNLKSYSRVNSV